MNAFVIAEMGSCHDGSLHKARQLVEVAKECGADAVKAQYWSSAGRLARRRNAQVYQLQDNHGKVTQLITMTAEFFDSHRDLEIRAWIEKHRLAQAMRQAGQAGVLVSQAGLQIEKR